MANWTEFKGVHKLVGKFQIISSLQRINLYALTQVSLYKIDSSSLELKRNPAVTNGFCERQIA